MVNPSISQKVSISVRQIVAARGLLRWTQRDLARASGVGIATIDRIEAREGGGQQLTYDRLQATFEHAGLAFVLGGVVLRAELNVDCATFRERRSAAVRIAAAADGRLASFDDASPAHPLDYRQGVKDALALVANSYQISPAPPLEPRPHDANRTAPA